MGPTRGERVYLIREALGTRRDPMPLDEFAELIARATGVRYDKSTLSRMETGERKVSLEDIETLAQVDPLKRGRSWLAGWDDEQGGQGAQSSARTPRPTPDQIVRTDVQGVPTKQQPVLKGKVKKKDRPGDRSAVA